MAFGVAIDLINPHSRNLLLIPDFQLLSAVLYHPALIAIKMNYQD